MTKDIFGQDMGDPTPSQQWYPDKDERAELIKVVGEEGLDTIIRLTERLAYVCLLDGILADVKEFGDEFSRRYYDVPKTESQLALDFRSGDIGFEISEVVGAIFEALKFSEKFGGTEYRRISETPLPEIRAIDISAIGIPLVISRDSDGYQFLGLGEQDEGQVQNHPTGLIVTLQDLDRFRLTELERIQFETGGDSTIIHLIKTPIETFGLHTDRIFKDEAV